MYPMLPAYAGSNTGVSYRTRRRKFAYGLITVDWNRSDSLLEMSDGVLS